MADVYATLADGGYRNTPIAITKVVFPDGHVDENWGKPHRVKVLERSRHRRGDEHPRARTSRAARRRARRSTARRPPRRARPSELVDAWLDGYTPDYATAVWMGYPNKRVSMTDVHGEPQQGGYLPAEIWHAYMAAVTEGKPCVPFPPSKEAISYKPFYGKYATHRAGAGSRSRTNTSQNATITKPTAPRQRPRRAGAAAARRANPNRAAQTPAGTAASPHRPERRRRRRRPARDRQRSAGGAPALPLTRGPSRSGAGSLSLDIQENERPPR